MSYKCEPYQAKNVLYRYEEVDRFYKARYGLNPYRGCYVGCRYCYVQQKKYADSTGLEEAKKQVVQAKINAPYLLKKKLEANIEPAMIVIGESGEPYGDIEDEYFITRRLLEILKDYDFPIHIITRFSGVLRDIDIIKEINKKTFACVTVSLPVVSGGLVKKFDGHSPDPKSRLKTVKELRKNDITAGVAVSPVIPYVSDGEEVNKVLKKASAYKASYVITGPLAIKDYQRTMFFSWLEEKFPRLVDSYERLYKGGENVEKDYWDKFMEQFKRKAMNLNLKVEIPFEADQLPGSRQEIFKLN
ncbi:MAG: radical SAM protein [Elusimicrobia bacterium]|jgi:DNA repair photolyase|nr:radical SAM protein [Elusimicrobiota bacterium]